MSTKPWEQDWEAGPIADPQWAVFAVGGEYVVNTLAGDDEAKAKFIRAAPDMARVLMGVLQTNGHTLRCCQVTSVDGPCSDDCEPVRSALIKAGVL